MANRYLTLDGTKRIQENYTLIPDGFDKVQHEMDTNKGTADNHIANADIHVTAVKKAEWDSKAPGSTLTDLNNHKGDSVAHVTQADHDKLGGIDDGAQVNQNAFSKVNGIEADSPTDEFTIVGDVGIEVTHNPNDKSIHLTVTSESAPGNHAATHLTGGSDPIPVATETTSGLMSPGDKMNVNILKETLFQTYDGKKFTINNPYVGGGSLSLKGQLHCHTTNSDGVDSPVDLVTAYKNAGYDFLTITDHNFITPNPGVSGITWIGNGCEETYARHIIAYDIDEKYTGFPNAQDIINFHQKRGKMTSVAHPNWRGAYILDNKEVEGTYNFNFIEVYNAVVNGYGEKQWDYALSSGNHVFATATDDCHNSADTLQFNRGWVVVFVDTNNKQSILESLRKGNFYASTGNDLTVSVSGNILTVSSSSLSNFEFIGVRGTTLKTTNNVTTATYEIRGDERYVRVRSTNVSTGKFAWSNPIFVEALNPDNKALVDVADNAVTLGVKRDSAINGNMDVWQRGIVFNDPQDNEYTADRWQIRRYPGGGTAPSSVVIYKSGIFGATILPDSNNYLVYRTTGKIVAGTGTFYALQQFIENGTRNLCGSGKKITVSFDAVCSVPGKKIGVTMRQAYGQAGSGFSPHENLIGNTVELDVAWKRFSVTFNTEHIGGKTFAEDDFLRLSFALAWDSAYAPWFGETDSEGTDGDVEIGITRVQINSGDTALPYLKRTFAEELALCQRYYEKSYDYATPPTTATGVGANSTIASNAAIIPGFRFKTPKRKSNPTVKIYSPSGTPSKVWNSSDVDVSSGAIASHVGDSGCRYINCTGAGLTQGEIVSYHYTVDAEF